MGGLEGGVVSSFWTLDLPLGVGSVVVVLLLAFGGGGREGRRREVLRGVFAGSRAPEEIRRRGQAV